MTKQMIGDGRSPYDQHSIILIHAKCVLNYVNDQKNDITKNPHYVGWLTSLEEDIICQI